MSACAVQSTADAVESEVTTSPVGSPTKGCAPLIYVARYSGSVPSTYYCLQLYSVEANKEDSRHHHCINLVVRYYDVTLHRQ